MQKSHLPMLSNQENPFKRRNHPKKEKRFKAPFSSPVLKKQNGIKKGAKQKEVSKASKAPDAPKENRRQEETLQNEVFQKRQEGALTLKRPFNPEKLKKLLQNLGFNAHQKMGPPGTFWGGQSFVLTKTAQGSSNIAGFKKRLFNQVMARGDLLYPAFNRRKHNHTHKLVVYNQLAKLSKSLSYLSVNKIRFYIGFALNEAGYTTRKGEVNNTSTLRRRTVFSLVGVVETDTALLLTRWQRYLSLAQSRQSINHAWWQPFTRQLIQMWDTAHYTKRQLPLEAQKQPLLLCLQRQKCKGSKNLVSKHGPWIDSGNVLNLR